MPLKKDKQSLEAEVWNAITAFEQILEAMPNDRASLEALSHAYEQIGDLTKAREYFVRLGNIMLEEGDIASAQELLPRLEPFSSEDEAVSSLMVKIVSAYGATVEAGAAASSQQHSRSVSGESVLDEVATPKKKISVSMSFNMSEELAMAWNLMEAHEITQEEYASIVQDLTEMSAGDVVATISVLHVLEARGFKNIDRIIAYLVGQCSTPFVSLSNFDFTLDAVMFLPVDFAVRRGAFVFELVGHDALAVVLNPYDKQLRKDVESLTSRKCHFFITQPSEFDRAVGKTADMIAEKQKEEAAQAS